MYHLKSVITSKTSGRTCHIEKVSYLRLLFTRLCDSRIDDTTISVTTIEPVRGLNEARRAILEEILTDFRVKLMRYKRDHYENDHFILLCRKACLDHGMSLRSIDYSFRGQVLEHSHMSVSDVVDMNRLRAIVEHEPTRLPVTLGLCGHIDWNDLEYGLHTTTIDIDASLKNGHLTFLWD